MIRIRNIFAHFAACQRLGLLAIEIPLVLVFTAYSYEGQKSLAALGIILSILLVVNSPGLVLISTIVKLCKASIAFTTLRRFTLLIGMSLSGLLILFLLTPLSNWFFTTVLSISQTQIVLAKAGLWIFTPAPLIVTCRRFYQGLLIHMGKTRPSLYAAGLRLVTSITLAFLLSHLTNWSGIIIGTLTLTCAALLELIMLWQLSRKPLMPIKQAAKTAPLSDMMRLHLPLVTKNLLQLSYSLLITIGLAHFSEPAASFIIWPVIYGLLMILDYPLQEIEPISVALFNQPGGKQATLHFSLLIGSLLAMGLIIYSLSPLAQYCFAKFYNFSASNLPLAAHALLMAFAVPILSAIRAWLRGILFIYEQLWAIQIGALSALSALVIFFVVTHSLAPPMPGIYSGISAFSLGYLIEAIVLTLLMSKRWHMLKTAYPIRSN